MRFTRLDTGRHGVVEKLLRLKPRSGPDETIETTHVLHGNRRCTTTAHSDPLLTDKPYCGLLEGSR